VDARAVEPALFVAEASKPVFAVAVGDACVVRGTANEGLACVAATRNRRKCANMRASLPHFAVVVAAATGRHAASCPIRLAVAGLVGGAVVIGGAETSAHLTRFRTVVIFAAAGPRKRAASLAVHAMGSKQIRNESGGIRAMGWFGGERRGGAWSRNTHRKNGDFRSSFGGLHASGPTGAYADRSKERRSEERERLRAVHQGRSSPRSARSGPKNGLREAKIDRTQRFSDRRSRSVHAAR
jgi:hypothetical protein